MFLGLMINFFIGQLYLGSLLGLISSLVLNYDVQYGSFSYEMKHVYFVIISQHEACWYLLYVVHYCGHFNISLTLWTVEYRQHNRWSVCVYYFEVSKRRFRFCFQILHYEMSRTVADSISEIVQCLVSVIFSWIFLLSFIIRC